jgi:hypothetical protein
MYHIYWFAYVGPPLHPSVKSHLIQESFKCIIEFSLLVVLVSICYCDKRSETINLKWGKVYFVSQFQRFWFTVAWPWWFGVHHCGRTWRKRFVYLMAAGKQKRKGLAFWFLLQRHNSDIVTPLLPPPPPHAPWSPNFFNVPPPPNSTMCWGPIL